MFLITVVVPVYNSFQYLENLFSNLSKQQFADFSCIFVYDKSTDETLAKLQFLIAKYPSLHCTILVKPRKEGAGKARDFAIESGLVSSKYVLFLDSDDNFSPSFLSTLFERAEATNADITMCGYRRIDPSNKRVISTEMVHNPDFINDVPSSSIVPYLNPAPWNKLMKFSIIQDARFIHKGGSGEDMMFFAKVLPNCQKIAFVNEPLYDYFVNPGSVSSLTNEASLDESKAGYLETKAFYAAHGQNFAKCMPLLEAFVFLRVAIGETTRVCLAKRHHYGSVIKGTKKWLTENFPHWKHNKYISFWRSLRHGMKTLFIWRCKFLYSIGCFGLFVFDYKLFTSLFKKDIKW